MVRRKIEFILALLFVSIPVALIGIVAGVFVYGYSRAFSTLVYMDGDPSYGNLCILQKDDGQWYAVQQNNRGEELAAYSYSPQLPATDPKDREIFDDGVFVSDRYGIVTYHNTAPPMGIPYLYGHCGDMLIQMDQQTQTAQCVYQSFPHCRILYGNDDMVLEYDANEELYRWVDRNSKEVLCTRQADLKTKKESYKIRYDSTKQEIQIAQFSNAEWQLVELFSVTLDI